MGKASRWFRGLLGLTKPDSSSTPSAISKQSKQKKWSFVKSHRVKVDHSHKAFKTAEVVSKKAVPNAALPTQTTSSSSDGNAYQMENPGKRAISVAAASAAMAEEAAAVVKLTSSSGRSGAAAVNSGRGSREEWAAVTIQSHFRAYLAKRAFKALRALVKLQALVRGHMVRKQSADILRRMHALLRAQARARAGRAQTYDSSYASIKSAQFHHTGPATPEKYERPTRAKSTKQDQLLMFKRNGSKSNCGVAMDQDAATLGWNWVDNKANERSREQRRSSIHCGLTEDDKSDNILGIDAGKPLFTTNRKALFPSSHLSLGSDQYSNGFIASQDSTAHQAIVSPYSCEVHSLSHLEFLQDVEDNSYCTADNSPQYFSASSRGGSSRRRPFSPTKRGGSGSCLSGYSNHPSYMAYTESSRAKMRSLSAPKQRPRFERSSSTNMCSYYDFGDSRLSSTQRVSSSLYANFTSKAYPGSGRLDRLGMPIRR